MRLLLAVLVLALTACALQPCDLPQPPPGCVYVCEPKDSCSCSLVCGDPG